jgi:hypothetical protein
MVSLSANSTRVLLGICVLMTYVGIQSPTRAATFDLNFGSPGFHFGVNQGLSLSGTGAFDTYSIDIRFSFDSVNASFNGYQRILDFKDRTSDTGLYSLNGRLILFGSSSPISPISAGQVFTDGTLADLLVTRDATGQFSAYVNGDLAFSIPDLNSITRFSGPNNIIYFFIDDFQSLATHPTQLEAGSGFIDSITVQVFPSAVPEPSTWAMMLIGFVGLGFAFRQSRRKFVVRLN